ncbi:MAG: beta-glucuronidase [Promicromonosporaceae bacterium]|nr:beta-glucuronidase [Promicromonosporaceae bacterium]
MLKPQSSPTRDLRNLDGMWQFALDSEVGEQPWTSPLPTQRQAPVPASYNDLYVDRGIRDHVGDAWYQREIHIPRGWKDDRVFVRLDAACHKGSVYLDDQYVGEHQGGYLPFEFDITDRITPGTSHRLTVAVNNELSRTTIPPGTTEMGPSGKKTVQYHHDFYNYSGLHRSAWLYAAPETRVTDVTVRTDRAGADGIVTYMVETTGSANVTLTLRNEDGKVVATGAGTQGTLRIENVNLWQPGAAYLYVLTIELHDDAGELMDTYSVNVGVRTVEVVGTKLLINGEPFYFTGYGMHEDHDVRGKGHDNAHLVNDMALLKWTGANSFRTSHYPYAEEVLDYADRHGIIVIDETAAVGINLGVTGGLTGIGKEATFTPETFGDETREAHAQHIRELIARDKNHPSVVMWSIANEPASNEDGAREYFEPLVNLARELDPTRPLTYAIVMMANHDNDKIADLFDVLSINRYWGWYVFMDDLPLAEAMLEQDLRGWVERFGKPIMMTEYGADTLDGLHAADGTPWTEEFQRDIFDVYHRVFDRIPEFIGEQVWNFADFRTVPAIHRIGARNKKGVFTRDRNPKLAAHTLRERWLKNGNHKPTDSTPSPPPNPALGHIISAMRARAAA